MCVILHNICVGVGDELEEAVEEDDNQPPLERDSGESRSGAAWRATLTNDVSALHEAPLDHNYFSQPNLYFKELYIFFHHNKYCPRKYCT